METSQSPLDMESQCGSEIVTSLCRKFENVEIQIKHEKSQIENKIYKKYRELLKFYAGNSNSKAATKPSSEHEELFICKADMQSAILHCYNYGIEEQNITNGSSF